MPFNKEQAATKTATTLFLQSNIDEIATLDNSFMKAAPIFVEEKKIRVTMAPNRTAQDHMERIIKVLQYIHNNYNDDLNLETLAKISNYSTFHFHRIMGAHLGESLGSYILKTRLNAAASLLRTPGMSITEVAYKVGYESPSSFNKAFKKRFSVAPKDYRQNSIKEMPLENVLQKIVTMENLSKNPEFKTLPDTKVIYNQVTGDYNVICDKAWEKVCAFAGKNNLFGASATFWGICYDDPDVTGPEACRYEACIAIDQPIDAEGDIGIKTIDSGNFAVFTLKGPYSLLKKAYEYIFGKWVAEANPALREAPCMEKYLNEEGKVPEEELLTEIWIPVQ